MDFLFSLALWANACFEVGEYRQTWEHRVSVLAVAKEAPALLSEAEIRQHMERLPSEWTTNGTALFYEQTFTDFVAAIAFVNALVEPAEELGHHPDIAINYNRVSLTLTTHDANGLTALDFQLAERISQL